MQPTSTTHNLCPEITLLLYLLSRTQKEITLEDSYNWDYFSELTHKLRVAPLVYKRVKENPFYLNIPQDIVNFLEQRYYKTLQKNTLLYHAFEQIHTICSQYNISIIPLKGIFLAEQVYGDIGIRPLSDIDLLVPEQDIDTCVTILSELGYRFDTRFVKSDFIDEQRESKHIPLMARQNVGVEFHMRVLSVDHSLGITTQDFWDHTIPGVLSGMQIQHFHPHFLLLHICLHEHEHFAHAKIHFIAYVDIAYCTATYRNCINWKEFTELCTKYNCVHQVFSHIYLAAKYIGADVPDNIYQLGASVCDNYSEDFFCNHVQGNTEFVAKKRNRNIIELKNVQGFTNKVRFLLHDMFPSQEFMINRYAIRYPHLYFLYYPRRIWDGGISLYKYLIKKERI